VVTETTTLFLTVSTETYDRFAALVADGVPADKVLERLLDRDPHDHEHRCPTCARASAREQRPADDPVLFAAG
jgi:hypothetical protein